jgi:hypothetical protein
MEQSFAADPEIRRACAEESLAILLFSPPLDATFDYREKDAGGRLQKALEDLAGVSGYAELAGAPLFPFGHSVSSIFVSHVVSWTPSRCFGALSFKGGLSLPANDPAASLVGVPILVIKGQFEEFGPGPSGVLREFEDREAAWREMSRRILEMRARDEGHLIALLIEPGGSHFAWSTRLAPYAAGFIRQAARQRIPSEGLANPKEPVKCRAVEPRSGALTTGRPGQERTAAPWKEFSGDRKAALWHLDLELARLADELHAGLSGKKPQFVTFSDPETGKPILVGHDLRLKFPVHWVGPDTFKVGGQFLDRAADKYPKVEGSVGHAGGEVSFRSFCGPVEQTGADVFRVGMDPICRIRADILAFHPGDGEYRYAEQQGRAALPARLAQGPRQTITFAPGLSARGAPVIERHERLRASGPHSMSRAARPPSRRHSPLRRIAPARPLSRSASRWSPINTAAPRPVRPER